MSNAWYRSIPKGDETRKYYAQDLKVTAEHLENAIDDSLLGKCFETYLDYPSEQRGGPLLFRIMIDKVQTTTATAVEYILKTIIHMKVNEIKGENVSNAVSLIRGGLSRVRNYRDPVSECPKQCLMISTRQSVRKYCKAPRTKSSTQSSDKSTRVLK
jgi:hypothetical protein